MGYINTIGCVTVSGYKNTQKASRECFGGKSVRGKNKIDLEILLKTEADTIAFADWYFNTINGGVSPFDITLPIFGKIKEWNVEMITDISHSLISISSGTISFSVSTVAYIDNEYP